MPEIMSRCFGKLADFWLDFCAPFHYGLLLISDKDDVLGLGDKIQGREGTDLPLIDAGLDFEREGLERPRLAHLRSLDARAEGTFLSGLPFGAQQLHEQCRDRRAVLVSGGQIFTEPSGSPPQFLLP